MAWQQPLLFALKSHPLLQPLCEKLPAGRGRLQVRRFPDGESYLQVVSETRGRHCLVVADLSHPDDKFLPLLFLAETLRELGAASVGLVAPYLCYMRQDRRFIDGEAVTSRIFARQVSAHFDWLVTVDPHLHRYHSLDEIYSIPNKLIKGAPAIADWLTGQDNLFLVGPDEESEQWVSDIAAASGHPWIVGRKVRRGDRDVSITMPDLDRFRGRTAVVIDDVISSGHTILECLQVLQAGGIETIDCACVHGIFADGIDQVLHAQGLRRLASCNTVEHASNQLDVSDLLASGIRAYNGYGNRS
jgi:ribose-phosphate pyrophosphokinase